MTNSKNLTILGNIGKDSVKEKRRYSQIELTGKFIGFPIFCNVIANFTKSFYYSYHKEFGRFSACFSSQTVQKKRKAMVQKDVFVWYNIVKSTK